MTQEELFIRPETIFLLGLIITGGERLTALQCKPEETTEIFDPQKLSTEELKDQYGLRTPILRYCQRRHTRR